MIYLDNSATTYPKPQKVVSAVSRAMREYCANPGRGGHSASIRAAQAVYSARRNIADFFELDREENVIFTSNCTSALNTVIHGVLREGDHVIISSLEHNSVLRPIDYMREKGMITYSVAEYCENDDMTVDSFRKSINERTRMIICTHASNVFGIALPVERLCALAHSYRLLFCLDAAQSAGVFTISIENDHYDYVCCAGHKGLYGPMGTGLLLIGSDNIPYPLTQGGTGSQSSDAEMPQYLPDRLESGTLNVSGIVGLSAGVSFVRSKGTDIIRRYELEHVAHLYNGLKNNKRVRLFTPDPKTFRCAPVISFSIDGTSSEKVAEYLDTKYGIAARAGLHCAPLAHRTMGTEEQGTVRISPSVFTKISDMQTVIKAVNNFAH